VNFFPQGGGQGINDQNTASRPQKTVDKPCQKPREQDSQKTRAGDRRVGGARLHKKFSLILRNLSKCLKKLQIYVILKKENVSNKGSRAYKASISRLTKNMCKTEELLYGKIIG
jgi:hypothetical protein